VLRPVERSSRQLPPRQHLSGGETERFVRRQLTQKGDAFGCGPATLCRSRPRAAAPPAAVCAGLCLVRESL